MTYLTDEETNKALVKAGKVKTMNEKECEKKLVKQLGSLDVREEIVLKEAYKKGQQEVDEILLDVLFQACGEDNDMIDNRCTSAYEDACEYLAKEGLIIKVNDRMFKLLKEGEDGNKS